MPELTVTAEKAHQDFLDLQQQAREAMAVRDGAFRELYQDHGLPLTRIQQIVPAGPGYERLRQIVGTRR